MSSTSGIASWENRYDVGHSDPSSGFCTLLLFTEMQLSHALADPPTIKPLLLLLQLLMD